MELHCGESSLRSASSFLGIHLGRRLSPSLRLSVPLVSPLQACALMVAAGNKPSEARSRGGGLDDSLRVLKAHRKDNIWSVDNDVASKEAASDNRRTRSRRKRGGRRASDRGRKSRAAVLVSDSMLVEIDTVLQTQEPVIIPSWETFTGSLSGILKGVGAVFSPLTAEMEPIGIGKKQEKLYDCYTLSQITKMKAEGQISKIRRKTNWVACNPFGEMRSNNQAWGANQERDDLLQKGKSDFGKGEILDEDCLSMEPGLVFFEDGSYSCGPFEIPVHYFDEPKYFLSPTFKFEQCLVKGCHKRLRIVHTIEFAEGGASIQIIRVALYEEQWDQPAGISDDISSVEFDLKPFSQRRRTQPSELSGLWKVFEVNATPVSPEGTSVQDADDVGSHYVYFCTETLKRRSLPEESRCSFAEEEMRDVQSVTVLWLTGGVTAYVDVSDDGVLCIGVGWYSDEGINLVMERDYGTDGKLKEVRWKSEVKRRWKETPTSSC